MTALADASQSMDGPADFGDDPSGVARRWISEIELAEKDHRKFWQRGRKAIARYLSEETEDADARKRKLAVLWSNMETLEPSIFARAPVAVVGRRWKDADSIGRLASEVLERALNFTVDGSAFVEALQGAAKEYLLVGRGIGWVRYVAHMRPVEAEPEGAAEDQAEGAGAEPSEEVAWEEVSIDHVSWDDWLHNPARKWAEVRWVARMAYMTRDELVARFGADVAKAVPLDHGAADKKDGESGDQDQQFAKATVYEIWDKTARTVFWISKGYPDGPLDQRPDPLRLKDFFPCPRPALATRSPGSILPFPDHHFIKSQLRDIDDLTARIGLLQEALKLRGFYASGGEEKEKIADLFDAQTNTLIPVDAWAAFAERGGIKGLIEWVPLDMVVQALQGCVEARRNQIADVYQVTGIADILRGEVDAGETATASRLKGNWGALRVRNKQKEMARLARDLLRIAAEVIATQFAVETLAAMTDVKLFPTQAAKDQAQQQLQAQAQAVQRQAQAMAAQAQQTGQQAPPPPPPFKPPPALVDMLQKPTWEDLESLLRDNVLRGFRIDVETDSTIEPDDQEEKQRRVEFVQAVGEYVSRSLPALQMLPQLLPVIAQGLMFLVRGFRVGREMEDTIERAMDQITAAGGQPPQQGQAKPGDAPQLVAAKVQGEQARAQADLMRGQAALMQAHTGQFEAQAGVQLDQQRIGAENARTAADRHAEVAMHGQDVATDIHQAVMRAMDRSATRDMMDRRPITAPTE